jgi:ADP-ribose pyrophosphatase
MTVKYRGQWFTVREEPLDLPNGTTITAEWVERTDGVRVIARNARGQILINDEYRAEIRRRDLRLPGGKIEDGRTALQAAQAELQEETGFRARSWRRLGSSQPFTMVRYRLHYFEAADLILDPVDHDEGEDITIKWLSLSEVVRLALTGEMGEDLSALQVLRLAARESAA